MFCSSGFQVPLGLAYVCHTCSLATHFVDYGNLPACTSTNAGTGRLKGCVIAIAGAVHFFEIFDPPHQFGCYVADEFLTEVREFMI